MTCLALHSPKTVCVECGTPEAPSVSDIYAWMRLEQSIVCLYKGDITDHCLHDLACKRTAEACGVSRRFVERTLRKHKVITDAA